MSPRLKAPCNRLISRDLRCRSSSRMCSSACRLLSALRAEGNTCNRNMQFRNNTVCVPSYLDLLSLCTALYEGLFRKKELDIDSQMEL